MDRIESEVQRYTKKKEKLTNGFVARMSAIISGKRLAIRQTQETIIELENKVENDQVFLEKAEKALQTV